jgi:hypothetical protein
MARKALLIGLAVLILGAAVAGAFYWRWYTSPRYSLHQMVLALKTRNLDDFFKYLDLKEIFNNLLQASSKDLEIPGDKDTDEWSLYGRQLGRKLARHFLPKLFEAFEQQLRGVMEGYLRNLDNSRILALAAAVSMAKIEVNGDEARVTMVDPKTKGYLRFQMRRMPEKGTWRIVAVNYNDLKKFVKSQFQD